MKCGKGGKIHLQFDKPFWGKDVGVIKCAGEAISEIHVLALPSEKEEEDFPVFMVSGLILARESALFEKYKGEELRDLFIVQLKHIFG